MGLKGCRGRRGCLTSSAFQPHTGRSILLCAPSAAGLTCCCTLRPFLSLQLQGKRGSYNTAVDEDDPAAAYQLLDRHRHARGFDPGQRDEGTTGAPAQEGAIGRAKRVDDRGIPNSSSVTGEEHRHLLCTRQVSK